jgi:Threonylcarbamoyl adenosine biosynthesis protein TsaE
MTQCWKHHHHHHHAIFSRSVYYYSPMLNNKLFDNSIKPSVVSFPPTSTTTLYVADSGSSAKRSNSNNQNSVNFVESDSNDTDSSSSNYDSGTVNANNDDDDDDNNGIYTLKLSIPTSDVMEEVGALIAVLSRPMDCLFLDGDLGSGKTTFSRGFIGCKLGIRTDDDSNNNKEVEEEGDSCNNIDNPHDSNNSQSKSSRADTIRITSPTYLLSNTYGYMDDEQQLRQ